MSERSRFSRIGLSQVMGVHAYHLDRGELFEYGGKLWKVIASDELTFEAVEQ